MRDFSLVKYRALITQILDSDYQCLSFEQYGVLYKENQLPKRFVILRHDVDAQPKRSLVIAQLESSMGICSTYYFRVGLHRFVPNMVQEIATLGHEIGYHYEDLNASYGDVSNALKSFEKNLKLLRHYYPVTTVCMHGNPRVKFDEGELWGHIDAEQLGLIGEPYHTVDFDTVFYLTDTGRRWDGYKVSVWDKVAQQEEWNQKGLSFHSTNDLLGALKSHKLPDRIMITTHPQRWTDHYGAWLVELVAQRIKNMVKRVLVSYRF